MTEQNEHQITSDLSTFITKGVDGWRAGFSIGVQTFYLQPVGCEVGDERDTEERAKWYQKCLDTAFKNLSPTTADASVLKEALEKIIGLPDNVWASNEMKLVAQNALSQYNAGSLPGSQGEQDDEADAVGNRGTVIGTIAYDPIRKDLKVTVTPEQAQSGEPDTRQEEIEKLKDNLEAAKMALRAIETGSDPFPMTLAQNTLRKINQ